MEPVTAEDVGSMDSSKFVEGWKVTLPEDGSITHLMRYCVPEGGGLLKLYLVKDGGAVPLDTQKDGQYLCFNADGTSLRSMRNGHLCGMWWHPLPDVWFLCLELSFSGKENGLRIL